jgi:hypothetical protein
LPHWPERESGTSIKPDSHDLEASPTQQARCSSPPQGVMSAQIPFD